MRLFLNNHLDARRVEKCYPTRERKNGQLCRENRRHKSGQFNRNHEKVRHVRYYTLLSYKQGNKLFSSVKSSFGPLLCLCGMLTVTVAIAITCCVQCVHPQYLFNCKLIAMTGRLCRRASVLRQRFGAFTENLSSNAHLRIFYSFVR